MKFSALKLLAWEELQIFAAEFRYPWMVTVSDRHNPNSFYPTELLTVAPSQRVKLQQQTPDQVAAMIKVKHISQGRDAHVSHGCVYVKASATLPQSRMKQTKIVKEALDICSRSARLAEAGISVDDEFVSVSLPSLIPPLAWTRSRLLPGTRKAATCACYSVWAVAEDQSDKQCKYGSSVQGDRDSHRSGEI